MAAMSNLLYLVHRLPYPPNKGDKVRSYHLLKHLAARHRVFLGTFVDDPEDMQHIERLRPCCADLNVVPLNPRWAKLRSLDGLLSGEALTLRYYRDRKMLAWVEQTLGQQKIDAAVVFSSAMGPYVDGVPRLPILADFVDVDSAKWTQYAPNHRWPMSWLYRREGQALLDYERRLAARADRSFFVTANECDLFRKLAPECAVRVEAMGNGVDAAFFQPDPERTTPFAADELPLVFTGAMDYWPNVDAVCWFVENVLPGLRAEHPQLSFYVVGRSPTPAVQALASDSVVVTGTVPDVRPYLQHAAAVVAPLRVARGVQNKILEAMAMGRPVIAAASCVQAIDAEPGRDLLAAESAEEYQAAISGLLNAPAQAAAMGQAGRALVLGKYSWEAHMAVIDRYLGQEAFSTVVSGAQT